MNYKSLGLRIREARLLKNITQQKLSELAGLSPNYVSSIERATGVVSLETLVKLANILEVSPLILLQDSLSIPLEALEIDRKISYMLQSMSPSEKEYILEHIEIFKGFYRKMSSKIIG